MLVEAVSKMQPTVKMIQPPMIVLRRPIMSAISPAITAPKNVPAERIEVVSDWFEAEMTKCDLASASLGSGYGRWVYCLMKSAQKSIEAHSLEQEGL